MRDWVGKSFAAAMPGTRIASIQVTIAVEVFIESPMF
jgi:hypothetical protein